MWRGRGFGGGFFPGMGMGRRRRWRNRMFGGPFGGWGIPGFGYGGGGYYGYGRPRVSCCCLPFFLLMLAVPLGLVGLFAMHVI